MKTAGLMTFCYSTSYGANLQAYALQFYLNELGYKSEFINYNRFKEPTGQVVVNKSVKFKIRGLVLASIVNMHSLVRQKNIKAVNNKLEHFRNEHLCIAEKEYQSLSELKKNPPVYDVYITGSDQVFNPTANYLEAYLLSFVPSGRKKVAYAPSLGVSRLSEQGKRLFEKQLHSFNFLSCREKDGADLLSSFVGRTVETVLDPTFLLDSGQWDMLANRPSINEKYLLCYFLGSMQYGRKMAQKIAKKKKLKVLILPVSPADFFSKGKTAFNAGPMEMLGLIKNAEFVCTDSFHGVALSLNYRKKFLAFKKRGSEFFLSKESRISNLLDMVGLSKRLIDQSQQFEDSMLSLDYSSAEKKLLTQIEKSRSFLITALQ